MTTPAGGQAARLAAPLAPRLQQTTVTMLFWTSFEGNEGDIAFWKGVSEDGDADALPLSIAPLAGSSDDDWDEPPNFWIGKALHEVPSS